MACTMAESCGASAAVTCAPILLSTWGLHSRLYPAPLGCRRLDVKSARSSLEWTTPKVPKPLNENIDGAESALPSPARAGFHRSTTRAMADSRHHRHPPPRLAGSAGLVVWAGLALLGICRSPGLLLKKLRRVGCGEDVDLCPLTRCTRTIALDPIQSSRFMMCANQH